jgi:cytoskeletal protein RodZ
MMKRVLAVLIAIAWCSAAFAQTAAQTTQTSPTNPNAPTPTPAEAAAKKAADRKAKQQMVQSTTEQATSQASQTPLRGSKPAATKTSKPTTAQRKEIMEGANKSASSQYGPAAADASAKVDKNAPKVAKPNLADPKTQEAMQKASKQ